MLDLEAVKRRMALRDSMGNDALGLPVGQSLGCETVMEMERDLDALVEEVDRLRSSSTPGRWAADGDYRAEAIRMITEALAQRHVPASGTYPATSRQPTSVEVRTGMAGAHVFAALFVGHQLERIADKLESGTIVVSNGSAI